MQRGNGKGTRVDNLWRVVTGGAHGARQKLIMNRMQRGNGKGTRDENLGGTSLRADECACEFW